VSGGRALSTEPRSAASRRDNPDQWVSGGHEKFETPMRSVVSERDLREKLMRESRLQERREGGEAILHGGDPEKPSGLQPAATTREPALLEDAQALRAAAEHVEGRYPGMAALMRRCATRLYQSLKEAN